MRSRVVDLSPNKVAIVLGGVLLVCGAAMWFLLVSPKQSKVDSLSSSIKSEQSTLQQLKTRTTAKTHHTGAKHAVSQTLMTTRALPNSVAMPQVLLQLNRIATEEKVSLDAVTPAPPIVYSDFQAIPITITLTGSYFGIEGFLQQVRKQVSADTDGVRATGRLYDILSVNLQVSPTPPKVTATMTIDAFEYTGVPLPAPGSTSTTTTSSP